MRLSSLTRRIGVVLVAIAVVATGGAPASTAAAPQARDLSVVTTLTSYHAIAREIVSPGTRIESIASPRQDAHFVQARPSYSMAIGRADLLIGTGLDLEIWLPAVVDRARNRNVRSGADGFVAAAYQVPMLEVPDDVSRSGGDIHVFGNPHVHTDPLRDLMVAANIRDGLKRVDPGGAAAYDERFADYERRIHQRLFGAELVQLVGGDKLADEALANRLDAYLEATQLGGAPLSERLGGWLGEASCLRGARIVPYHLNWAYFLERFGIEAVAYVERRPGIPPSASHVAELVEMIRREGIEVLWVSNYYDRRTPELIAERTGAKLLYVPLYQDPDGDGPSDTFELFDHWIGELRGAVSACGGQSP